MLLDGVANIINSVKDFIGGIFVTKAQKTKNEMEAAKIQAEITKAEVNSNNPFVSFGRAFFILICDICIAIVWIPQYGFASYFFIMNCLKLHHLAHYPLDTTRLTESLVCLLGLVGIRFITKKDR